MLRVGIIGVGTVGASVANILRDNKNIITARAGKEIVATIGVVSNLHKIRDVDIKLLQFSKLKVHLMLQLNVLH